MFGVVCTSCAVGVGIGVPGVDSFGAFLCLDWESLAPTGRPRLSLGGCYVLV